MAGATVMGPWQPLTWLTWALDHSRNGLSPYAFHASNIFLHAAGAGVLTLLLKAVLDKAAPAAAERRRWLAAGGAALLWAVHPLRVESVAWITERREVLCAYFYALSALLYLKGWSRSSWLSFVAACLSKGSAVTLPLSLLVLDVYPLRRKPSLALVIEKAPFLLVSLIVGLIGLFAQGSDASLKGFADASPSFRVALALRGLSFYLEKTVAPIGLSPFYPVPDAFGPLHASVLASSALLGALLYGSWRLRRSAPAVPAALALYAVALLPLLGLVRFGEQLAADRYAHLSGFALAGLASAALLRVPAAALPLALLLGGLSWRQSGIWRSDAALWAHAERTAPSRQSRLNLSAALRGEGRLDEAAELDRVLTETAPGLPEPRVNYAGWLSAKGRHADALAALADLPTAGPWAAKARYNRALALDGLGRAAEARAELRAALEAAPDFAEARNNLGLLLRKAGRDDEAQRELARAAALRPDWAAPWFNRGLALASLGRLKESLACFERAAALGEPSAAANAAAVRAALKATAAGR